MGSSAGANIAYQLGLRSTEMKLDEVKVRGVILNQPYIGGVERTESEERSVEDKMLPLASSDLMWELALPVGESRDHEYCNPMRTVDRRVKLLPKTMVKGFKGDMLYDRQKVFVEMLKKEGVEVEVFMEDEGHHGVEMLDTVKADRLMKECRKFIYGGDNV